jgi:hypothetical protein
MSFCGMLRSCDLCDGLCCHYMIKSFFWVQTNQKINCKKGEYRTTPMKFTGEGEKKSMIKSLRTTSLSCGGSVGGVPAASASWNISRGINHMSDWNLHQLG